MSIATLIMGESGTGKSTSLRNLDPANTLLIQAVKKPLPFRSPNWKPIGPDGGNVMVTDDSAKMVAAMKKTMRDIIVIDDFQYVMANEFLRRVLDNEVGNQAFAKYNEIARKAWDVFMCASSLPDNKRVYILSHTATDEGGKTKIKTIGKLLDEKIVLEGLVTIVLRTLRINDQYIFATQNSGSDTTKSPLGLFEDEHIENDMAAVDKAIVDYYGIITSTK
ncbi:MAG: AAA family ATPase [Alphaproteobacteria bacterium]|nr:AAA family ATPase [Alphaproteobacteria bacterium]